MLEFNEIVAIVAGYVFALVGGFVYVTKAVEHLQRHEGRAPSRAQGHPMRMVGLVERALYVTALLLGHWEFVAVWLLLKIAADWRFGPGGAPTRHGYTTFLVGSGLSVMFAVVGAAVVRLGGAEAWLEAVVIAGLLLIGAEVLRWMGLFALEQQRAGRLAMTVRTEPEEAEDSAAEADAEAATGISSGETDNAEAEAEQEPPADSSSPRARRTPEEIDRQAEDVLAVVRANPGGRAADIAEAVGASTAELRRPIQLLLEQRMLRKEGEGRQTTYRPGPSRRRKVSRSSGNSAARKSGGRGGG